VFRKDQKVDILGKSKVDVGEEAKLDYVSSTGNLTIKIG